jgi:hypothetical protein
MARRARARRPHEAWGSCRALGRLTEVSADRACGASEASLALHREGPLPAPPSFVTWNLWVRRA